MSRKTTTVQLMSIDGNKYHVPLQSSGKVVRYCRFEDKPELLENVATVDTIVLAPRRRKSIVQDRHQSARSRPKKPTHIAGGI